MQSEGRDEHRGRILAVDDEVYIVEILAQWLTDDGYRVRQALNFDQVRAALDEEPADLVTLDIMMPKVNGLEILRWIRENHPDTGVVMATAVGDQTSVLTAMRLGAFNYLMKPFNLELVTEEINRAMTHQRLAAENRAYQRELEARVEAQTKEIQEARMQLERYVKELEARNRLVHFQMSTPSVREAYEETLTVIYQVVGLVSATIYSPSSDGRRLEAAAALGISSSGEIASPDQVELASGPESFTISESSSVSQAYRTLLPQDGVDGEVAFPLVYRGETLAVLKVEGLAEPDRGVVRRLVEESAVLAWAARIAQDLDAGQLEVGELLELGRATGAGPNGCYGDE